MTGLVMIFFAIIWFALHIYSKGEEPHYIIISNIWTVGAFIVLQIT